MAPPRATGPCDPATPSPGPRPPHPPSRRATAGAGECRRSNVLRRRAGLGASELGPASLTARDGVKAIHRAAGELGLPERTIVTGQSLGGMLALDHAAAYPDRVAALVLVDPMNPRLVAAVGDWLDTTVPGIERSGTDRKRVIVRMTDNLEALSARLLRTEPGLTTPMIVLSAGDDWWGPADLEAAWRTIHEQMATVSGNRSKRIAEGVGQDAPADAPDVVVAAILELLPNARDAGDDTSPITRAPQSGDPRQLVAVGVLQASQPALVRRGPPPPQVPEELVAAGPPATPPAEPEAPSVGAERHGRGARRPKPPIASRPTV